MTDEELLPRLREAGYRRIAEAVERDPTLTAEVKRLLRAGVIFVPRPSTLLRRLTHAHRG